MQTGTLTAEARREKIIDLLNTKGKVRVAELAQQFAVSEVSIRNDLIELEKNGALERTHGGALPTVRTYYNMDFYERKNRNVEEKKRIAAQVAVLVKEGDTLMINSGTTSFFIVAELKKFHKLKVITNSVANAMELSGCPGLNVTLLGGKLNPAYSFTYGDDAIAQLNRYNTDVTILSIDGVAAEHGLTTYHEEEAEVDRVMLARAKRRVVAADFSKIARESFAHVAACEEMDCLVTNTGASREELALLEESGVEVVLA